MSEDKIVGEKLDKLKIDKIELAKTEQAPAMEQAPSPEKPAETGAFSKLEQAAAKAKESAPVGGIVASSIAAEAKENRLKQIEGVLADNLEDVFANMTPAKQMQFKQAGEETARKLNGILDKAKVKVKEVIAIIKKWLSMIPSVNKFFLEQEAKIKADEIMKIKEEKLFK